MAGGGGQPLFYAHRQRGRSDNRIDCAHRILTFATPPLYDSLSPYPGLQGGRTETARTESTTRARGKEDTVERTVEHDHHPFDQSEELESPQPPPLASARTRASTLAGSILPLPFPLSLSISASFPSFRGGGWSTGAGQSEEYIEAACLLSTPPEPLGLALRQARRETRRGRAVAESPASEHRMVLTANE